MFNYPDDYSAAAHDYAMRETAGPSAESRALAAYIEVGRILGVDVDSLEAQLHDSVEWDAEAVADGSRDPFAMAEAVEQIDAALERVYAGKTTAAMSYLVAAVAQRVSA